MNDLLTEDEQSALELTAELSRLLKKIVHHDPHVDGEHPDSAELRAAIHVIQRAIGAQAAARAYPDLYRLLGE